MPKNISTRPFRTPPTPHPHIIRVYSLRSTPFPPANHASHSSRSPQSHTLQTTHTHTHTHALTHRHNYHRTRRRRCRTRTTHPPQILHQYHIFTLPFSLAVTRTGLLRSIRSASVAPNTGFLLGCVCACPECVHGVHFL